MHSHEIDWTRGIGGISDGLARAAVEGLRRAWYLQGEQPGCPRRDEKRMRNTAGRDRDSARADSILAPLDVHQDLSVEHVQRLILIDMCVQGGGLALCQEVLEQDERPRGLIGGRLPRMHAATVEPAVLTLPVIADYRHSRIHCILLRAGVHRTHATYCSIMSMTVPYELAGRTNQKARTRDALVAAVRELLAQGVTPTMEGAAEAAAISRRTAYRYFPNLRALLIAAYPHIEERSLLGPNPPEDPVARLKLVAEDQTRRILKYEPEMRAVLRLSLEPEPDRGPELPMHRGLRIGWIEEALAPLRGPIDEEDLRRLVYSIGATLGIEAFVWLTDVAQLSHDDAAAIMRSNALALLRSALPDTQ